MAPDLLIDGELRGCCIGSDIGQQKSPGSPVAGRANVLFQTLGQEYCSLKGWQGYSTGTIGQGLAKPVNDLSGDVALMI